MDFDAIGVAYGRAPRGEGEDGDCTRFAPLAYGVAATVDECPALHIGRIAEAGLLRAAPGVRHGFRMASGMPVRAAWVSLTVQGTTDRPHALMVEFRPAGGLTVVTRTVCLGATRPRLGGTRWWLVCPGAAHGGDRPARVAALYVPPGSANLACRRCYGLAYPSQRQDADYRLRRRIGKLRARLGADVSPLAPLPCIKPLRMHWRTFHRLRTDLHVLEARLIAVVAAKHPTLMGGGSRPLPACLSGRYVPRAAAA